MAGAMGMPFLPTLSGFGPEILTTWGFFKEIRQTDPQITDEKLAVLDNPFGDWGGTSQVVAVPAINPDVTIIHIQKADPMDICSIQGLPFADIEQVKASWHVIVTCEDLVDKAILRKNPDMNQIPFIHVSAVCHNAPNNVIFFKRGAMDSLLEELPFAAADPRIMYWAAANSRLSNAFATMQNRITGRHFRRGANWQVRKPEHHLYRAL